MVRFASLPGCADVRAVNSSRATADDLRVCEVVIEGRGNGNSVGVVTEDVDSVGVVRCNRAMDSARDARIHDTYVSRENAAVQTCLPPVARLIAIGIITRRPAWAAIGESQLSVPRNKIELRVSGWTANGHNALRRRKSCGGRSSSKAIKIPHCRCCGTGSRS